MSSICISNCVKDVRVPVRATYVNLYKWPESDAEFVKTVTSTGGASGGDANVHGGAHPRVVDSISCRQMYLRSYTFSKKENFPEKTKKCFGKVKNKVVCRRKRKGGRRRKCMVLRKMKEISCSALLVIFNRFFSCSASVDVVD